MQTSRVAGSGRLNAPSSSSRRSCSVRRPQPQLALSRLPGRLPVRMRAENDPDKASMEVLFAEELKKRGLDSLDDAQPAREAAGTATGTSTSKSPFQSATKTTPRPKPAAGSAASEGDQRQRSIALVNEGLEGLIPRASELIKLGGSIFLAFVPFILAISLMFGGIYAVFGEQFVHGGGSRSGPPAYVDPERLLSEPTVDPYIPFH